LKVQYEGIINTAEFSKWNKENRNLDFGEQPTFPYPQEKRGLKIGYIKKIGVFKNHAVYHVGNYNGGLQTHYDTDRFKMILHPPSDLTNPITVEGYNDGKEFIAIVELAKIAFPEFSKHTDCQNYMIDDEGLLVFFCKFNIVIMINPRALLNNI